MTQFYEAFLRSPPTIWITDRYAEFAIASLRLALFRPHTDHQTEFGQPANSAMSLCLEVSNLEAAIARLDNLGYAPAGSIIQASHGREIYAYDPDGNRLILHQMPTDLNG
jgi:hypothetical protein